ncbi:acyltransferase [Rossellomorea sp. NRS-1567]|uniref:acyltransferase n=1 Tax=Rossellomorea sp. NRS-1567 TaxID=3233901 RepID=UPI003D2E6B28
MSNVRGHISEIHILRAIACLLVLFVHVSATFYYQQGQQFNDLTFFINQISRFGTPMFALISGFLLFYQARFKRFDFSRFVSSRFTKIGLPFLFWSIFYLLFMFVAEGVNPLEVGEKQFLVNFTFGNSFYHLYFMSIVFQFYLLFPLLQLVRSKKSWAVLLGISILINVYSLKVFSPGEVGGLLGDILGQRAFLPNWIYFFIFGGFLAYYWEPLSSFAKRYKGLLGVAVILITLAAVWEYKVMGSIASNRVTNIINIPIITLFIIGVGSNITRLKWTNMFMSKIGALSMAIYLAHPFVLYCFQEVAPQYIWKTSLFPVIYLIILLGTILMVKAIQLLPWNQYILTVPKIKTQQRIQQSKYSMNS